MSRSWKNLVAPPRGVGKGPLAGLVLVLAFAAGVLLAVSQRHGVHRATEPASEPAPIESYAADAAPQINTDGEDERRVRVLPRSRRNRPSTVARSPLDLPIHSFGVQPPPIGPEDVRREFYFTRAAYSGYGWRGIASWSIDYPDADQKFMIGLKRLVNRLDAYDYQHPILLTDPKLFEYPFLYAVEVGYMALSPEEAASLRRYLLAGGFFFIDDFWGSWEWANLQTELQKVLPEFPVVDIPLDHPIFHTFYNVDEIVQVPNVGQARMGGPTWEKDGYVPTVRGVFDDEGRLLVLINWNNDLGDAWEHADDPYVPLKMSTYAYQIGVNVIVYAMSH